MYLKIILTFFILFFVIPFANASEIIDAKNNAYIHNNKGLIYLEEKYYYGAIKEFQMAIDLLPKSQASASFYTNLGTTYEKIGYDSLAQPCFEKALSLNPLYFDHYIKLANNYKNLGIIDDKLVEFKEKKHSPLSDIMVGLLYIEKGEKSTGITILDDFCNKEPNLLITTGVKNYLKEITSQ